MKLAFDRIWELSRGAVRREILDGALCLRRFTPEEQLRYRARREESYLRGLATAGMRIVFETDSPSLTLGVRVLPSTSRRWFCHSVFADGKRIGELRGRLEPEETARDLEARFDLGPGRKEVCILLPWSVESRITKLETEGDAVAVAPKKRLLAFGDSITQGYDAHSPEDAYIVKLAEALRMDLLCKAIGGERFWPELPELYGGPEPDMITVAYGTNDWAVSPKEMFLRDSRGFLTALRSRFPGVPVTVLAPIWRADRDTKRTDVGSFDAVAAHLEQLTRELPGMRFVDCGPFVPRDTELFADGKLHPNSDGFRHYSEGLLRSLLPDRHPL